MSYIPDAISVVIPTYNRAHLIKASIQSVLDQTLQPYEIIVVDDFSTDNTEEVVNSFNSPLIKYVKNQRKKGANGARNTGILMAKGEFIAFHDSDDVWLPQKLEIQKSISINEKIDICFCSILRTIGTKKIKFPYKKIINIENELYKRSIISTQTIFLKREKLGDHLFDENIKRFQDWDFCLGLVGKVKFYHIPEILVIQNIQSDSISSNPNLIKDYLVILNKHADRINKNSMYNYIVMNSSKKNIFIALKVFFYKIFIKLLEKVK